MSSAPATILPDSECLRLLGLVGDDRGIVATVAAIAPTSVCPQCGHPSQHIHSHYVRHVSDLPWHGVAFRLDLHVRRFFCDQAACPQRIFTERLPEVVAPSARMTLRLAHMLQQVAVELGGAAGTRLVMSMGVRGLCQRSRGVSRDTLLRLIRRTTLRTLAPLAMVSLDDFSFHRKNHQGGTIVVALERHRVVDLLDDCTTTAATAWLRTHPEITILSRDRGESYTEAARLAAPQAIQVADRWHIWHNLSEVTQAVLERHRLDLRKVAPAVAQKRSPPDDSQIAASLGEAPDPPVPPPKKTRCSSPAPPPPRQPKPRQLLFDQTKQLAAQGWSKVRIAQHLRLNRRTVMRYIVADHLPEKVRLAQTTSSLAPYDAYLLQRWTEGCHIGTQLFADLREQGCFRQF